MLIFISQKCEVYINWGSHNPLPILFFFFYDKCNLVRVLQPFPLIGMVVASPFQISGLRLNMQPSQEAHQTRAYTRFCSMKRLGLFSLPHGCDAGPSQSYPQYQNNLPVPIYMYTPGWREALRVKRLNQEHKAMILMFKIFLFYLQWMLWFFLRLKT